MVFLIIFNTLVIIKLKILDKGCFVKKIYQLFFHTHFDPLPNSPNPTILSTQFKPKKVNQFKRNSQCIFRFGQRMVIVMIGIVCRLQANQTGDSSKITLKSSFLTNLLLPVMSESNKFVLINFSGHTSTVWALSFNSTGDKMVTCRYGSR